jgi:hypothetical protein
LKTESPAGTVSIGTSFICLPKEECSVVDKPSQPPLKNTDEEIIALFEEWLTAFEKTQSATGDEEANATRALTRIESLIAATPAEGPRGLVVKFGLNASVNEHADAASELATSAYADLIRLTGHDP